jgi:hypothetical protein
MTSPRINLYQKAFAKKKNRPSSSSHDLQEFHKSGPIKIFTLHISPRFYKIKAKLFSVTAGGTENLADYQNNR